MNNGEIIIVLNSFALDNIVVKANKNGITPEDLINAEMTKIADCDVYGIMSVKIQNAK